jgi:hypothetical protein
MNDAPDDSVEVLQGGVANAGAVVRIGQHVLRPANPHTSSIHGFLTHLREAGFDGASQPVGVDPDGRERLVFIAGEVPVPPYPAWSQSEESLASVARLMRRFHDASAAFPIASDDGWSMEMADVRDGGATGADPGLIICHNDVCLENVVFRDGVAVALLDFDFAAPGRRVYDLAQFARMCVPIDDPHNASRLHWAPADLPERLRLVLDTYGLPDEDRDEFFDALADGIERGGQFVLRRVEAGDPNFIAMWNDMGGMERFNRRRGWFADNADRLRAALH